MLLFMMLHCDQAFRDTSSVRGGVYATVPGPVRAGRQSRVSRNHVTGGRSWQTGRSRNPTAVKAYITTDAPEVIDHCGLLYYYNDRSCSNLDSCCAVDQVMSTPPPLKLSASAVDVTKPGDDRSRCEPLRAVEDLGSVPIIYTPWLNKGRWCDWEGLRPLVWLMHGSHTRTGQNSRTKQTLKRT